MNAPAQTHDRPGEIVAGFLAMIAIVGSAVGLVTTPVPLTVFGALIALLAAGIGGRHQRLATFAVFFSGACFVVGLAIAIVAGKPIF